MHHGTFNADKGFYYINYSVIQGFPALRKAVTTHVKKIGPSLTWLGQVNEWTAKPYHSQFMVVCRIFFGLWLLKYWRVCIVYRQWRSNFPGKENQNKKSRTGSYVFSGFGNGISRGWERKSTTNRFATGRFWLCTWKIFIFIYIFCR